MSAFAAELVARALAQRADSAQAVTHQGTAFEVNFDARRLTLLRSRLIDNATLRVFCGGRQGSATLTGRDPIAVASAVNEACAAAEASPDDPANGIAEDAVSAPSAELGAREPDRDAMISLVLEHIEEVQRDYPLIHTREALYEFADITRGFANSADVTRSERRGTYRASALFNARRDGQSTSMAHHGASSFAPFARLMEVGELRRIFADSSRSFDPRPVSDKFVGDIILTPEAVGPVLVSPLFNAINGYALLAGTSPYRDSIGKPIAAPAFSLLNQPAAADFPHGATFDDYGCDTEEVAVVRDGVLRNYLVEHYISRKLGIPRTAGWWAVRVPAGLTTLAEIIRQTDRGVILTRFSGGMPSADLDFSGIAKNAFYVEDGRLRHPLKETMISGNLRDILPRIRAISSETVNFGGAAYPSIAVGGVTISGG